MIRFLKISLFAVWCTLAAILIGNFIFHGAYYLIGGTAEKFLSPVWLGIILTTILISVPLYFTLKREWGRG